MDNRDQVAALVAEGVCVYADWRKKRDEMALAREQALQAERDLGWLEARRDAITHELRKLGFHDVGHAKRELAKDADHTGVYPGRALYWSGPAGEAVVEVFCEKCGRPLPHTLVRKDGCWSGLFPFIGTSRSE